MYEPVTFETIDVSNAISYRALRLALTFYTSKRLAVDFTVNSQQVLSHRCISFYVLTGIMVVPLFNSI
jgi:hypothetical protein